MPEALATDERPQVGADGVYEGESGRWTTIGTAAEILGISERTVNLHLPQGARTLDGLDRGHREVVLYLCDDIAAAVEHVTKTAREIPSGAIYTTSTNRRYATLPIAAKTLGITLTILKNRTDNVSTLKARVRNTGGKLSRVTTLYCLEDFSEHPDIKAMLDALAQEAQADVAKTVSGSGPDDWLTVDAFYNSLPARTKKKTSKKAIRRQLVKNSCASKPAAKPGTRLGAKLYRREDLWKTGLRLANSEIKVDRKTGFYRDRSGNRWATRDTWGKKKAVTGNALNYGMQKLFRNWENTPRIRGLGMVKREDWLYSEKTIDKILAFIFEAEYQLRDDGAVYKLVGEIRRRVQSVYADGNKVAQEAHVSADQVRRRLGKEECRSVEAIHRHTGLAILLFQLNQARRIFREQIRVKVDADDIREVDDPREGRCVTMLTFVKEQGREKDVKWRIAFGKLVKRKSFTKLRRRDPETHRIFSYYPVNDLKRIARSVGK